MRYAPELVQLLNRPQPFEVPWHDTMYLRVCGQRPHSVLTVERLFYSWKINEYREPLFIHRGWWYAENDLLLALMSLFDFIQTTLAREPNNWIRADCLGEATRRARIEFGERVIYTNEDD